MIKTVFKYFVFDRDFVKVHCRSSLSYSY